MMRPTLEADFASTRKAVEAGATPAAVLVSLHPEHSAAILAGTKTLELRRVLPAQPVSRMVIYETLRHGGAGAIVGVAAVVGQLRGITPECLLASYPLAEIGVTPEQLAAYFAPAPGGRCSAFVLGPVERFPEPVPLPEGYKTAPQSWRYLDNKATDRLLACSNPDAYLATSAWWDTPDC